MKIYFLKSVAAIVLSIIMMFPVSAFAAENLDASEETTLDSVSKSEYDINKSISPTSAEVKSEFSTEATASEVQKVYNDTIKLSRGNFTLGDGETAIVLAEISGGNYTAQDVLWSISNTRIANLCVEKGNNLFQSAVLIETMKTGSAVVTAKLPNGEEASLTLTVKSAPTYVKLSTSSKTLGVGETYIISESTNSGSYAANFTWSSSNTNVATVEKTTANKAKITAKNVGTAKIIIETYNGRKAECVVTVKSAPTSVKLSASSKTLGVGETYIISESTNSGSYAANFTWSSSNTNVATVEKTTANKAQITAKNVGTAKIIIETYNGRKAECVVTVKSAPTSVKLSASSKTLGVGETYIISESTNSGSYAANFTWSSSNTNVATVEKTTANKAKITAKSTGTAVITIKTYNGKTASCTVNVTKQTLISVPYISQQYNYPTGCESVSATMLLQYYNFNITPDEFIDDYLTKKPISYSNGNMTTASPYSAFIGSPYSSYSYGCYSPVIEKAMNKYLSNTSYRAKNTSGTSLETLAAEYIENGQPVIIWATMNMVPTVKTSTWVVNYATAGDPYPVGSCCTWLGNEHCLVLVGQTADCYILNDPYNSNGVVYYSKSLVNQRFVEQGKQSIIIEKR